MASGGGSLGGEMGASASAVCVDGDQETTPSQRMDFDAPTPSEAVGRMRQNQSRRGGKNNGSAPSSNLLQQTPQMNSTVADHAVISESKRSNFSSSSVPAPPLEPPTSAFNCAEQGAANVSLC